MKAGFLLSVPAANSSRSAYCYKISSALLLKSKSISFPNLEYSYIWSRAVSIAVIGTQVHTSRSGIGGMPIRQNSAQAFLDRLAVPICSDAQFFLVITWVAQITATATEHFSLRTKRGYQ
ncbi:hypothetical protein ACC713_12605 [Rhizobium johnstonii]|uniref:hypothetical protein n=1 Tax=Rhizobium TaxID=379 RepID=UPI00102FC65D|nr:hypothetical protein [Rhizobium leguminosarum]TBF82435.1 hypothetical protein ELG86_09970 [Rhizobium leguminosarum]TBF98994.1 hypothetical protein ELG85_09785 [Rhizobium leguminosarum]TBG68180.1 hypothetical protein ELG74_10130 [Rhizobium leguminosarum]TBH01923.1 hypothetical protein ELG70_09955 [Rhizobium leguminosarum]TBH11451.1 hypothetical protein ELG68_10025 [Rhizobium leguminosarum]